MADQPAVHIGENSPEKVAHQLMQEIARVEGKVFHKSPSAKETSADRAWIIDTYAECIQAVRGQHTGWKKA